MGRRSDSKSKAASKTEAGSKAGADSKTTADSRAGAAPKRGAGQPEPSELERLLGHRFRRPELLTLALTHRSFVYDSVQASASSDAEPVDLADPSHDNEQLEFVGDAVLGLLAADALCRRFPGSREGELTRLRASVISRKHLGTVGTRLDLGRWLRLGHTAEQNQARHNAALFANTVEALIAALYLDGGLEAARRFVEDKVLAEAIDEMDRAVARGAGVSLSVGDHKSALQEMLQAGSMGRPIYRLVGEDGPDHRRVFRVEVQVAGAEETLATAEGSTKKQAQQEAARLALTRLRSQPPGRPA